MKLHTFTIYVEDRPGVLNRVASLFRRRAFNIESLSVGHSETTGVSRMTVVAHTDDGGAARMKAHLLKLIPVVRVDDITGAPSIVRELALVKVRGGQTDRAPIMQLAEVFGARVVDVRADSLVVEICASEAKVDGLIEVLRPYGVVEMVRTGRVAMARGSGAGAGTSALEAHGGPSAEEEISHSV